MFRVYGTFETSKIAFFNSSFNEKANDRHILLNIHCIKGVRIRNFSGLYFPIFGLNTERYGVAVFVSHRIQSECGKIRTRKNPNTDTFHVVIVNSQDVNK